MLRVEKKDDEYVLKSEETIAEFLLRNLENRFPQSAINWRSEEKLGKYFPENNDE